MKKKLVGLLSTQFGMTIALALGLWILNFGIISIYWKLSVVGGWDGSGHAAAGEYYAKHIFPNTWGWIPNWMAGMPFPQFYPPLFFFLAALFSKIFFFAVYTTVFKIFVIFLQLLVPGLMAWITKNITKNTQAAWLAGLTTIVLCYFPYFNLADYGIAIASTLNTGFLAQLLSFVLFIGWLNYFLKIEQSVKARYISMILLWGVFLSNSHIIPIVIFYFIVSFVVNIRKQNFLRHTFMYIICGGIPLLLTSFWFFPLVKEYTYLLTMPLNTNTIGMVKNWWFVTAILCVAIPLSIRYKEKNILIISLVNILIVLISTLNLEYHFPTLPIHTARWLAEYLFLTTILFAYIAHVLFSRIEKKYFTFFLYSAAIGIMFYTIHRIPVNTKGLYRDLPADKGEEIISYMKNRPGRIVVESYASNEPVSFTFDSVLGFVGDGALTFVLRESSISNLFTVPVRNSVSENLDIWGIRSFKAVDKSFLNRPTDENIDRAASMGAKYFLIRSPFTEKKFNDSSRVVLEKDFGNWKLYAYKENISFAEILPYEPVLLFSTINFKDRKSNEYNYSRFQEELFLNKKRDYILANARDLQIDTNKDLQNFKIVVISDYVYADIEKAYQVLSEYSLHNQLVLVYNQNPLFNRLSTLDTATHHIHIAPRNIDPNNSDIYVSQTNFNALFDRLDEIKIKADSSDAKVTEAKNIEATIKVSLDNPSKKREPVLINTTYFPTWTRTNNEPVYLATPTFMLTFADSDFEMNFQTDHSVRVGQIVSLITLLALIGFWIKDRKRI